MTRGQPGPGDPKARGAGPGPGARFWVSWATCGELGSTFVAMLVPGVPMGPWGPNKKNA